MITSIKRVCCIGAGYVGGPTMTVLADKCPEVIFNVVDMNLDRIKAWNSKDLNLLPIYEPGLKELIAKCRDKNLIFSSEVEKHIASADMVFISVNTPTKKSGIGAGKASDLKWIESCARQIGIYAKGHTIVVEKSTLPVKTAQTIKSILSESLEYSQEINSEKKSFAILSNPEFLAEGTAVNDLEEPDRVLIGGEDIEAINTLKNIYLNWVEEEKIITTDLWSSELSKLIANAFLAQRISSINSISALCEQTDADIHNVAKAIGMDSRIGDKFLKAGPGFGGSCFKKDISNLVYICNHYGLSEVANYWEQIININNWQRKRISEIIVETLFGTISGKKIAILGFSFKPDTNDTRESPAIEICKDLLEEGCNLSIYDPRVGRKQINTDLGFDNHDNTNENISESQLIIHESANEAIINADAIVIITNWQEFYNLDFHSYFQKMRRPSWIFDTRDVVDEAKLKNIGFKVWKLGKGEI